MKRGDIVLSIAHRILAVQADHPVRVGIDGRTAAGKSTLRDELASLLMGRGREVIVASVDDFHNPPEVRYRQGRFSPQGYYEDAVDYVALRERLLDPLGPGGSRAYRAGGLGRPGGRSRQVREARAGDTAILLCDGVFLFRPELNDCWDFRIFVEVSEAVAMERGLARDAEAMGGLEQARELYDMRYLPGERLYLDAIKPWDLADAILVNDDPAQPTVRYRP